MNMQHKNSFAWITAVSLALGLASTGEAWAFTVADRYDNDLNTLLVEVNPLAGTTLSESYGENTLTPYAGAGPGELAIVNDNGNFFDKVITVTDQDLTTQIASGNIPITMVIQNLTDHVWTGYHIEFYDDDVDPTGANPLFPFTQVSGLIGTPGVLTAPNTLGNFNVTAIPNQGAIRFTDGILNPGESLEYTFTVNLALPLAVLGPDNLVGERIGMRQVATTTVPEPLTILGTIAAVGLGTAMRRKQKA